MAPDGVVWFDEGDAATAPSHVSVPRAHRGSNAASA
jgi:hypothetical protein